MEGEDRHLKLEVCEKQVESPLILSLAAVYSHLSFVICTAVLKQITHTHKKLPIRTKCTIQADMFAAVFGSFDGQITGT